MATMWCPECRSEYREGYTICADCGVALVVDVPETPEPPRAQNRLFVDRVPRDVPLVSIGRYGMVQAETLAAKLRSAGFVAVVQSLGTAGELVALQFSEGSRLLVPEPDVDPARELLNALEVEDTEAPVSDAELTTLAEDALGWSDPGSGAVV